MAGAQSIQAPICTHCQDPGCHAQMSRGNYMNTLIKNMNLIYCDSIGPCACARWLSGTEALLLQGFPVHPCFPDAPVNERHYTSFNVGGIDRSCRKVCEMAGNSMNVNVVGVALWHTYMNFKFKPVSSMLGMLSLMRQRENRVPDEPPAMKRRRLRGKGQVQQQ